MLKLWSELPGARARELAADIATLLWVALWATVSCRLYEMLAKFAEVGRVIQQGGQNLETAGRQIGSALGGIPVLGAGAADRAHFAIASAARPFFMVGSYMERVLLISAFLFSLIVLAAALALWLHRYIPWRWDRLRKLQVAHRVIRASTLIPDSEMDRLLASRALHRLSYEELFKYSPDPFGDWARGHYRQLAQAELASVGLRHRSREIGQPATR
jgi:hypothetical protein